MKKDDLWILNVTASHSQNLHNVRQRNCAAPMAHDPLINTLGLGNRLDFNQQAGGRCHLLPSVANRVEAPSLKRCLQCECLLYTGCHSAKTIGQFPITNGFTMIIDDRMTFSSRLYTSQLAKGSDFNQKSPRQTQASTVCGFQVLQT